MANPPEDRIRSPTTPFCTDPESAGANVRKSAESSVGCIEEFESAKDQTVQGTAACDYLARDLRKVSEDVANIKDTVSQIARIAAPQVGKPASHFSALASNKKAVVTMVLALIGVILLVLAIIFGVEALHEWFKSHYGPLPAFVILCSAWAVLGTVFLCLAFLFSKWGRRAARHGEPAGRGG